MKLKQETKNSGKVKRRSDNGHRLDIIPAHRVDSIVFRFIVGVSIFYGTLQGIDYIYWLFF